MDKCGEVTRFSVICANAKTLRTIQHHIWLKVHGASRFSFCRSLLYKAKCELSPIRPYPNGTITIGAARHFMAPRPSKKQRTAPKDLEDKPIQSSFDFVADNMVKTARNALSVVRNRFSYSATCFWLFIHCILGQSEKRRALTRKSIEERHDKEARKIEAHISALFDKRRQRVWVVLWLLLSLEPIMFGSTSFPSALKRVIRPLGIWSYLRTVLTRRWRAKLQVAQWQKLDALNKRRMHLEALILATMKSMERHTVTLCNDLSAIFEGRIEEIHGNPAVLQT